MNPESVVSIPCPQCGATADYAGTQYALRVYVCRANRDHLTLLRRTEVPVTT